jgi:hypothetical protein
MALEYEVTLAPFKDFIAESAPTQNMEILSRKYRKRLENLKSTLIKENGLLLEKADPTLDLNLINIGNTLIFRLDQILNEKDWTKESSRLKIKAVC